MSNKTSITVIISVMLFGMMDMVSCTHSPQVPEISFSKDIIPVLNASCVLNSRCHFGANSTNQYVDLDSAVAYTTLFAKELISTANPSSSLLYVEVRSNEMPIAPIAPLSATQQALILDWIKQGARNN